MAVSTIDPNGLNVGQLGGDKNIIINGGLTVSQRGDYTSATAYTTETFYLDRWRMWINGVSATVQQTTVTIGGVTKKAMKVAATSSATGYIGARQKIELQNIPVGANLVASCWVRSNNAYTRFRYNDFGGGDANSSVFTNDGNWEKVSFSIDSSSTTTNPAIGLIMFDTAAVSITSGDYIEFTDFQLEVGDTASDFEQELYSTTLQKCQRYYQRQFPATGGGVVKSSGNGIARAKCPLVQIMRVSPSVTMSGNPSVYDGTSTANISSLDGIWTTPHMLEFDGNLSATLNAEGRACMIYNDATQATGNLSSAGFILDAEL